MHCQIRCPVGCSCDVTDLSNRSLVPLFVMEVLDLKNILLCITVRLLKSIWRCVRIHKLAKSDVIIFYMTLIVAVVCSYSSGFIEWETLIHQ